MASVAPSRSCALAAVSKARRRGGRIRDLLRVSPAVAALSPRDRGLATRLAVGSVRASGLLDQAIDSHLRRGARLEPRLRDALRVAAFELLFLSTPAHVAVSQGVSLAATASPRARGLANAVLRRIAENDVPAMLAARERLSAYARGQAAPSAEGAAADAGTLVADVSRVAAVPSWLARATVDSVGAHVACRLALSSFEAPASTVALNLALPDGEAEAALADARLSARPLPWPGAFALDGMAGLAESGAVQSVRALPADLAAQMVSWLVAPADDAALLEVGQGRATKTILMAAASASMGAHPSLTSIDLEEFKVRVASERLARAGLSDRCRCLAFDARLLASDRLPDVLARPFETVFVDAPCSGSGTLRRHPEIAWSLEEGVVRAGGHLPALQLDILSAAAARVAPGGLLFYSTCSNLTSENEDVVSRFLASDAGAGFSAEPVDLADVVPTLDAGARSLLASVQTEGGFLRSAGASADGVLLDGHFLARLRRR